MKSPFYTLVEEKKRENKYVVVSHETTMEINKEMADSYHQVYLRMIKRQTCSYELMRSNNVKG